MEIANSLDGSRAVVSNTAPGFGKNAPRSKILRLDSSETENVNKPGIISVIFMDFDSSEIGEDSPGPKHLARLSEHVQNSPPPRPTKPGARITNIKNPSDLKRAYVEASLSTPKRIKFEQFLSPPLLEESDYSQFSAPDHVSEPSQ